MVREADTIGAASFTADEIVHKGRSARRRRRRLAGVAAVALVAVAALTATNLPGRGERFQGPAQAWPFPTSPAQNGPSATSLGISFANGSEIVPRNGPRLVMALPPHTYISRGSRVEDGWVVTTAPGYQAWFQPDEGGAPTSLASSTWSVSDDGRTLVVADPTKPTVTAYRMPSMTKLGETTIPGQGHIIIAGLAFVGDDVLISHDVNGVMPTRTSMWDLTSFTLVDLKTTVTTLGTANGSVLRLYFTGDVSCVDIMPISGFGHVDTSGTCTNSLDEITWGALSPDGRQAVLGRVGQPDVLVSTAVLHTGLWSPTPIAAARHFIRWESATTFLIYGDGDVPPVLRCTAPGACTTIGLPAGNPRITFLREPS